MIITHRKRCKAIVVKIANIFKTIGLLYKVSLLTSNLQATWVAIKLDLRPSGHWAAIFLNVRLYYWHLILRLFDKSSYWFLLTPSGQWVAISLKLRSCYNLCLSHDLWNHVDLWPSDLSLKGISDLTLIRRNAYWSLCMKWPILHTMFR